MQFEALKVFCDVARYRSFSQAARENRRTQPAVSQIVLQLERRLQTQLVDRSTRPLQLTELGKVYYEGCKGLVEQYFELEASIRNAQDQIDTTVTVAAIYSVGLSDMGEYVDRFKAQHPRARVHVEYLHPERVYEKVLEGTADLGLVSFPRRSRELNVLPWREEEMVLVCSPRHPLARNLVIRPTQLQDEKYIGFDKGLVIRREVDRFLRDRGVTVDVTLEFDNIENIKKAIEIGAGVAILPEQTLRREVEAQTLVALPLFGCQLARPLGIIHRRHPRLASMSAAFVALLQQGANGKSTRSGNDPAASGNRRSTASSRASRPGRNGAVQTPK